MAKKWCRQTRQRRTQTAREIGAKAENFALSFLKRNGLKLVARNVNYPFGEIDLIAKDREELVFIEVRFRSTPSHGRAAETISTQKQRRIVLASQRWLKDNQSYQNHYCRFDVIAIDSVIDSKHTSWEKNAFHAPEYQ
jgi:putative endonuclease